MGEPPTYDLLRPRRALLGALAALVVAAALSACGTSTSTSVSPQSTEASLLRESDISRFPAGSVERAFFEYWSSLQFRSWAEVAAYYDPRFRAFVGTANVIAAKKLNASTYPLLDPKIVRVSNSNGDTTVSYTLRLPEGTKELDSITWRKENGNWQIIYDSHLDSDLSQLFQNRVEIETNGSVASDKPPSAKAAKAAEEGAELQARFLQQELKKRTP